MRLSTEYTNFITQTCHLVNISHIIYLKKLIKNKDVYNMDNNTLKNKIRGSLIGGAIGDALGYQIEFDIGVRDKQVTRFKDDLGIISDDTQMTLFTANALLWRHARWMINQESIHSHEAVYYGYLDWYDTQKRRGKNDIVSIIKDIYLNTGKNYEHDPICWIRNIPELNKRQAPGNTCLSSLRSGKMGTINNPTNNSHGCGGVMRIVSCGLLYSFPDNAGYLAAECAAITHGHPLSHMASYMCAVIISMLTYNNATIDEAVNEALRLVQEKHDRFNDSNNSLSDLINLVNKAIELSKQNISDPKAIKRIGEGWHAEDALAIALYSCLKYPNSFKDAVICAANHDGDSDSTAAITGNILGAYLGISAIDQYYIDNVELKDVILEIADDLCEMVVNDEIDKNSEWIRKYG